MCGRLSSAWRPRPAAAGVREIDAAAARASSNFLTEVCWPAVLKHHLSPLRGDNESRARNRQQSAACPRESNVALRRRPRRRVETNT